MAPNPPAVTAAPAVSGFVVFSLGGAYFVEALTDELEARAYEYFAKIDELGGMVEAVKQGYPQREKAAIHLAQGASKVLISAPAKGADYTIDQVVGADIVQADGGKVVLVDLVHGRSTTSMLRRIAAPRDGGDVHLEVHVVAGSLATQGGDLHRVRDHRDGEPGELREDVRGRRGSTSRRYPRNPTSAGSGLP